MANDDPPVTKTRITLRITFTLPTRFVQAFENTFLQFLTGANTLFVMNYNITEHDVKEIK